MLTNCINVAQNSIFLKKQLLNEVDILQSVESCRIETAHVDAIIFAIRYLHRSGIKDHQKVSGYSFFEDNPFTLYLCVVIELFSDTGLRRFSGLQRVATKHYIGTI